MQYAIIFNADHRENPAPIIVHFFYIHFLSLKSNATRYLFLLETKISISSLHLPLVSLVHFFVPMSLKILKSINNSIVFFSLLHSYLCFFFHFILINFIVICLQVFVLFRFFFHLIFVTVVGWQLILCKLYNFRDKKKHRTRNITFISVFSRYIQISFAN